MWWRTAALDGVADGGWCGDGSNIHEDHVEFLRRTRRLPGKNFVRVRRAPEREISPTPEEGERVIFRSHCLHGFGLPASGFL